MPLTCAEQGLDCGMATDGCGGPGCGNAIDCGKCTLPQTCGGGGTPNVCGTPCQPKTCAAAGYDCGQLWDGCSTLLDCGSCPASEVCGAGGVPGQCSGCAAAMCVPQSCAQQGIQSLCDGPATDGCGNYLACGTCPFPTECCGAVTDPPTSVHGCLPETCWPATCAMLSLSCGTFGDACGGVLECGHCPPGETCGGGGPGLCGPATCAPLTCASVGLECGTWPDGCGGMMDCGTCDDCTPPCGYDATPGHCAAKLVSKCMPKTCADKGVECGLASDGCGNPLDCGPCPGSEVCRGGKCLPVCM
jgi:hypothetical protein